MSRPPNQFMFYHGDAPITPALLENGATANDGIVEFSIRDAVLTTFELAAWNNDELLWALSSNAQLHVLVAPKVGETLDVEFPVDLGRVVHVMKFHFPAPVQDSGYGQYAAHLSLESIRGSGLRVVSSFEPQSAVTASRLPFFFGFKILAIDPKRDAWPTWRRLLAEAIGAARTWGWGMGALQAAFALEAFIDEKLHKKFSNAGIGPDYAGHILRVGEKRYEVAELLGCDKATARRRYEQLANDVFSPRNKLAHGNALSHEFSSNDFNKALRAVVAFVWDVSSAERHLLIPITYPDRFSDMIDADFLAECSR